MITIEILIKRFEKFCYAGLNLRFLAILGPHFREFIQDWAFLLNPAGNDRPNLDGFDVITEDEKVPMNIFFLCYT